MTALSAKLSQIEDASSWRSLTVFSAYRLFLAAILLAAFYLGLPPSFLGELAPGLYTFSAQLYFVVAVALLFITVQRWFDLQTQVTLQLVIDIVIITLIIHSSGGLKTSLGSLLVIVVVAGGILAPGRSSIFIAAVATLSILIEAVYSETLLNGATQYSDAGLLGATFFATAILTQILSKKIVESQQLADERAADIANLAILNSHIISRMQIGVLVVDSEGYIQLSNQAATQLLGLLEQTSPRLLKEAVPDLGRQLWEWKQNRSSPFKPLQAKKDLPEVSVNAVLLESGESVLYFENSSALAQQAQQLKLASLGQLTASIAHEVRNPLSAINHAAELLAETQAEAAETTKLTDIIQRQSVRVNTIIETVLEMSRRRKISPRVLVLANWLEPIVTEFTGIKNIQKEHYQLRIEAPLISVYIDQEQLRQVIWNLLENAWHYANPDGESPYVTIQLRQDRDEAVIDIIDNGPGVSNDILPVLFEPFQSERQGGTGLGLYLARELCQANGARLNYVYERMKKSCFSVSIPTNQQETLQ